MSEFTTVISITILAVISPGPDFAVVTRNSYCYGTKIGIFCALGISLGVQVHLFYTLFGISILILKSPLLFFCLKLLGVCYLVYIGFKSFTNQSKIDDITNIALFPSSLTAFKNGFLTNALNPKTMFFIIAIYTQIITPGSAIWLNLGYGLIISAAHFIWFSLIALFFSSPIVRAKILKYQLFVDKVIGAILMLLGLLLLFLNI